MNDYRRAIGQTVVLGFRQSLEVVHIGASYDPDAIAAANSPLLRAGAK